MHDEFSFDIQEIVDHLREHTSSDFCGLACLSGAMLHWKFTSGASNERVKRMHMRPGQDLVGTALRTGRTAISDGRTSGDRLPGRCPLMLAERLVSAVVVPIFEKSSVPGAVILLGNRQPCSFSPDVIQLTEQASRELQTLMYA